MRIALVLVLLLALAACAPLRVGQAFDPEPFVSQVVRGKTSAQQVLAWLGPPSARGEITDADGRRFTRWLYYYGEGRLPRLADLRFRILEIHFDMDGKVAAYNWTGGDAP